MKLKLEKRWYRPDAECLLLPIVVLFALVIRWLSILADGSILLFQLLFAGFLVCCIFLSLAVDRLRNRSPKEVAPTVEGGDDDAAIG